MANGMLYENARDRFTTDDFAIVIQREFGRVIRMNVQHAVRLVSVKPGESMSLHDSNVMLVELVYAHTHTHIHTLFFPAFCLRASHRDAPRWYNQTEASLPLQTLMHRLPSCSCTTPRRRRQGETIAFVSVRLPFTPRVSLPPCCYFSSTRGTIETLLPRLLFTRNISEKFDYAVRNNTKSIWI